MFPVPHLEEKESEKGNRDLNQLLSSLDSLCTDSDVK